MGNHPTRYTIFAAEGQTWFMLTGAYRIEGDTWIRSVDVAWNPAWIGTEQTRQFKINDDTLQILTPWRIMPNWIDKGETRSIITFVRFTK
ncbi:lipocalin-like domain-containing protein [Orbus hercynius]|uniref:lipocalin-like domain-containing protein n=1 Tax=Orbus hercynius TaxID=593135 RepID=UPI001B8870E8|nr:lipocalin-like domain-containing protein [Orbus hercynius]